MAKGRSEAAAEEPLRAPAGRRRRYVPLAAAAVIALGVAVTLQTPLEQAAVDEGSAPAAPAPASAARGAGLRESRDVATRERTERFASPQPAATTAAESAETPQQALERIAALRREGKDEEADRALAEFRARDPNYAIPGEMLERLERRR